MPGISKSTFAKKSRAKQLKVCHRCARWTCNAQYRFLGMVSINHEDKIQFIKDGLIKESLDNLLSTLKTHPNEDVHCAVHDLWPHFYKEHDRLKIRPCLSVFKKTGWEAYPRLIEGVKVVLERKTKERCERQSQAPVHTHVSQVIK
jgi:hypothetical protein